MSACRVEFIKRVRSRRGGPDQLVLDRFADGYGQTRHLPEAQARALARSMARELQTGARVMAPGNVELARFVWHPRRREVLEMTPDMGWRDVR
jgi:hypothetical protein